MNLAVTVNRDGVVSRISGDEDTEQARCARMQLQRLRFDPMSTTTTFPVVVVRDTGLSPGSARTPTIRTGMAAVRGSLSRDVIRRVIRQHIRRVRYCYERQLQQDPNLNGRITVRFVISTAGLVQSASATNDTLGSQAVSTCVVQVVRTMRFPAPTGGGIVAVNYPFIFNTGATPMTTNIPSMARARVANGQPTVTGTLSRTEILRVIRSNQAGVRYCYERAVNRDPSLAGRITVRFQVATDGRVSSARVTSNTLNNNAVETVFFVVFSACAFRSLKAEASA